MAEQAFDETTTPVEYEEMSLPQVLQLAMLYQRDGRFDEAEGLYQQILQLLPDHPDALHYYGILKHFQKDSLGGIALIERALAVAPDYLQAHNNLGNIYLREKQYLKAEAAYLKVLELDPDFAVAYNNLGLVYKQLGRNVEAIDILIKSIQLNPNFNLHYQNLGNIFQHTKELEDALSEYLAALAQRPFDSDIYRRLSIALYLCGDTKKAAKVLQVLLSYEPDNAIARHMLSAYSGQDAPDRASDDFVRKTFDGFADSFDFVLKQLEYKAPFLVEKAVRDIPGTASTQMLDAGCGTGLCGPLLRPMASRLVGIDLSARMLERARAREVYDELVEAELTLFMGQSSGVYDIIVSADTLCYFGDLSEVLAAAANALKPGGYLVFTLERFEPADDQGFRLNAHGRYSHTQDYIRHTLAAVGLSLVDWATADLRMELGTPVTGFVVTAVKPTESAL